LGKLGLGGVGGVGVAMVCGVGGVWGGEMIWDVEGELTVDSRYEIETKGG